MSYSKLVVCATTATLLAPVGLAGEGVASSPRKSQLGKYKRLYEAVRKEHGKRAPGRNIALYGIRFKWISKSGKRRRWGVRDATAREISMSIRQLRALLGSFVRAVPPAQAPAGVMSARRVSPIPDYIVQCESGGSYDAYNRSSGARGRYQVIPSTHAAICPDLGWSPQEQDECAARIWRAQGPGAWACA